MGSTERKRPAARRIGTGRGRDGVVRKAPGWLRRRSERVLRSAAGQGRLHRRREWLRRVIPASFPRNGSPRLGDAGDGTSTAVRAPQARADRPRGDRRGAPGQSAGRGTGEPHRRRRRGRGAGRVGFGLARRRLASARSRVGTRAAFPRGHRLGRVRTPSDGVRRGEDHDAGTDGGPRMAPVDERPPDRGARGQDLRALS